MNSFKIIAVITMALTGLLVGVRFCYSQLPPGIPFNMEAERYGPQAKVDLPKVQNSPDFVDYFLEPRTSDVKPGDKYPLVYLRIPKKPHFSPTATSGPVRTYGQTLDMIWPDLAGLGEPGGAACLERYRNGPGGHCMNLVRVYIDFMWEQTPSLEQKTLENSDRDINLQYIKPVEEKSKVSGLELMGTENSNPSSDYYISRTTRYVSRDAAGARGLVIECSEFVLSPACETRFTSNKSPNIVIKILFVHALLPQWRQVVDAVQAKVGGMIVKTYSLQTKE